MPFEINHTPWIPKKVRLISISIILGYLFGIFVLLSLQFRTFIEPIVVMLSIPFSFIGVVVGNLLLGDPLTSQGLLGFASLAGVVVNDSILLIVFVKESRARGASALEAASEELDNFAKFPDCVDTDTSALKSKLVAAAPAKPPAMAAAAGR